MKAAVRRFFATTSREVIRMIKEEMGAHAMVLTNRKVAGGVEMLVMDPHDIDHIVGDPVRAAPPAEQGEGEDFHVALSDSAKRRAALEPSPAALPLRSERASEAPSTPPGNPDMMDKLDLIQRLLERHLAASVAPEKTAPDPERAQLLGNMLDSGFSAALARKLIEIAHIPAASGAGCPLRQAVMAILTRSLKTLPSEDDVIGRGGVYALVGPTGVGKTTTVAKLAARFVMRHGPNQVALLTTDCYRIGAQQQLATYGSILGVPVHAVRDGQELRGALSELADRPIILIDTVGMGQRDKAVAEQDALLSEAGEPVNRLLLLNAAVRGDILEEVLQVYRSPHLVGCIITKMDEAVSLAPVLDIAIRHLMQIFYVTTGQRVPEDLHFPDAAFLLERAFKPVTAPHFRFNEEETGLMTVGSMMSSANWVLGGA